MVKEPPFRPGAKEPGLRWGKTTLRIRRAAPARKAVLEPLNRSYLAPWCSNQHQLDRWIGRGGERCVGMWRKPPELGQRGWLKPKIHVSGPRFRPRWKHRHFPKRARLGTIGQNFQLSWERSGIVPPGSFEQEGVLEVILPSSPSGGDGPDLGRHWPPVWTGPRRAKERK